MQGWGCSQSRNRRVANVRRPFPLRLEFPGPAISHGRASFAVSIQELKFVSLPHPIRANCVIGT